MARNVGNWFENAREVLRKLGKADVTTYTASGAISTEDSAAVLNATGLTMTLGDGKEGQRIVIKSIHATSSNVVSIPNFLDKSNLTTSAQFDSGELQFDGTNWFVVNLYGTASTT